MKQETLEKFAGEIGNNFKQTEIGLIPEDWEVVKLGEVCKITMGQSPPSSTYNDKSIGLPFLQGKAEFGEIYPKPVKYCSKPLKIAQEGDILISVRAPVGDVNIAPFKCAIGRGLASIKPLNTERLFLFYFLIYAKKRIEEEGTGSTFKAIRKSNLESFKIPLPPLSEQRKIARVLDKIQQAIELQDRIIEQAERLKKSLMQKLFTEGLYGEEQKETEIGLIPKSWEVVKLGEVTNIKTSTSSPTLIKEYITSRPTNSEIAKILYLKVADLNLPINTTYIIESKEIIYAPREVIDHFNVVPPFSIIFPKRGGAISTNKKRITRFYSLIDPNLAAVTPSKAINIIFLYYWFITFDLLTITDRSPIPQLNKKDIEQIRIPLPPLEEQKQIAHILSTIDKKIEIEQKRKQVLKALFKTMLHKLMSGEIRLKEVEI